MQNTQYVVGSRGVETFITVINQTQEIRLVDITGNERYYIPLNQVDELVEVLLKLKEEKL